MSSLSLFFPPTPPPPTEYRLTQPLIVLSQIFASCLGTNHED